MLHLLKICQIDYPNPQLYFHSNPEGVLTVSSDTKLNLNLDLGYFRIFSWYCRTEFKPNLKEGVGRLASKSSASVQKKFLKMLAFFLLSKMVMSSFALRQMFVKRLLIKASPNVFRDFHNSFSLPIFSVNFVLKNSIFLLLFN